MSDKKSQAIEVAKLIKEASLILSNALEKIEEYDLDLDNYPEYWHDFNEHPMELSNIFVADWSKDSDVQVMVGDV